MKPTPKFKIPYTPFQKFLQIFSAILILLQAGSLAFFWSTIPEEVITHYNAAGVPDNTGNKSILIILLVFSLVSWFGFVVLSRFPAVWNIPIKITDENRQFVYQATRTLFLGVETLTVIMFFYMGMCIAQSISLGWWFTPAVIVVIIGTIAFYVFKLSHNSQN